VWIAFFSIRMGNRTKHSVVCNKCYLYWILKSSEDGVLHSGLLSFWTLFDVWYSKKSTAFRKIDLFPSAGEKSSDWHHFCLMDPAGHLPPHPVHPWTETDPVVPDIFIA
jgi:hypothetical protein